MDEVDQDADGDAAARGLGADQVKLVLGPVDQHHPAPPVSRVAGFGLVKRGGDHLGGVVFHRPGQPSGSRFGTRPGFPAAVPAAGRGDHIMGAAWCRLGVVNARQGGHPLAVGFLPGRQPGAHLALAGGGLGGGRA